jgi:hypothetical protein
MNVRVGKTLEKSHDVWLRQTRLKEVEEGYEMWLSRLTHSGSVSKIVRSERQARLTILRGSPY